jgi:hypothetical protein
VVVSPCRGVGGLLLDSFSWAKVGVVLDWREDMYDRPEEMIRGKRIERKNALIARLSD